MYKGRVKFHLVFDLLVSVGVSLRLKICLVILTLQI